MPTLAAVTGQMLTAPQQGRLSRAPRASALPPLRRQRVAARCSATRRNQQESGQQLLPLPLQQLARSAAAVAASGLLLFSAVPPGMAEITTVTPQQAIETAKPLKKQDAKKGRIWALFVLGATALFGTTVLLENNEKFFPAISRANKAMKAAREALEAREKAAEREQTAFDQRLAAVQAERQADLQADAAVLQGLQEARQRSSPNAAAAVGSTTPSTGATAAGAAAATASSAAEAEPEVAEAQPGASQAQSSNTEGDGGSGEVISSSVNGGGEAAAQHSEAEGEGRKPLFEISAEQIQASSERRMQELQQELEKRKTAAAAGAGRGASSGVDQK